MFRLIRRLPRLHPIPAALITSVLMVCALLAQALVAAGPAQADSLTGASPSSGSRLRSAPDSVQLSFDDLVVPGSGSISVSGPDGRVSRGQTQTLGRSLSQDLRGGLPNGTYSVSWTVRFLLGGETSGGYRFAVGPRPAPATSKPATPKATVTPKPKPKASATATPSRTKAAVTARASASARAAAALQASTTPPATAAAPVVSSIGSTGSGHLPSPVVLWGLILLLSVLAVMINRWRKGISAGVAPHQDDSRRIRRSVSTASTTSTTSTTSTASLATGSLAGTRASRRTAELPTTAQSGLVRAGAGGSRRELRQRPAPVDEEIPGLLPRD